MSDKDAKIQWAKPDFWGNEKAYVLEALDSTWISGGPFVDRLERSQVEYHKVKHALSASNGTTAIHMALLAIGIKPGDEVIIPGYCFLAAANVCLHLGAKPVFAEVDRKTWCMGAEHVEAVISSRTKAIVPVHTYGNVCPMDGIVDLARKRGVRVIEDAAESFGSLYKKRLCGTFGDCGTLSFQATKTISTGEGGMVLTNDSALFDAMFLYRNHGMKNRRYWHELAGHNFRLTNMQAALGVAQFEKLDRIAAERARMHASYRKLLSDVAGVSLQEFSPDVEPIVWAIAITLDPRAFPQGRDQVISAMSAAGIETRPGFYTPNQLHHLYGGHRIPICDNLAASMISLPSFPTITDRDIKRVCDVLASLKA